MTDTTFREVVAYECGHKAGHDEARRQIVAWLRSGAMFAATDQEIADAIERGDRFK